MIIPEKVRPRKNGFSVCTLSAAKSAAQALLSQRFRISNASGGIDSESAIRVELKPPL